MRLKRFIGMRMLAIHWHSKELDPLDSTHYPSIAEILDTYSGGEATVGLTVSFSFAIGMEKVRCIEYARDPLKITQST